MTLNLSETGKKIVQKAQVLLQERGYQFFSFQDLADSVGIRKASVHHYFKTKEDLAQQMAVDYRNRLNEWVAKIDAKKLRPRQKLEAYFEMFADISRNGKSVCPGGSLLMDWNNFSKPIQTELRELMKVHRKWLTELLEEALNAGASLIPKDQISAHALLIGSSLQGGLQIARANENSEKVLKSLFKQIEKTTFRSDAV